MADATVIFRTIVCDGQVVGSVVAETKDFANARGEETAELLLELPGNE